MSLILCMLMTLQFGARQSTHSQQCIACKRLWAMYTHGQTKWGLDINKTKTYSTLFSLSTKKEAWSLRTVSFGRKTLGWHGGRTSMLRELEPSDDWPWRRSSQEHLGERTPRGSPEASPHRLCQACMSWSMVHVSQHQQNQTRQGPELGTAYDTGSHGDNALCRHGKNDRHRASGKQKEHKDPDS